MCNRNFATNRLTQALRLNRTNLMTKATKCSSFYKIFIGSPSDLQFERAEIRQAVAKWNSKQTVLKEKTQFKLVEGSTAVPTLNRAQAEINKLLWECDYCIILFKREWGSEPNKGGPYSSGTEEEFFASLLSILDPSSPMTNTAVLFVEDPTPSHQVKQFKERLKDSFQIFYGSIAQDEVESSTLDLLNYFLKKPKAIVPDNILTSRRENVIAPFKKMEYGKQLIALGDSESGAEHLRLAAEEGGVLQQVELAKFYRRRGEIDLALEILEKKCWPILVKQDRINTADAAIVLVERANIDLNQKKAYQVVLRGKRYAADYTIDEIQAPREFAELFDCIDRAHYQLKEREEARTSYEKAKKLRDQLEDPEQTMRSVINLGRLELKEQNYDSLNRWLLEADRLEDQGLKTSTLANLQLLRAQTAFYRDFDYETTIDCANRALEANEFEVNEKGIAYSLMLIAQSELEQGKIDSAQEHARRGLEINEKLGNEHGIKRFQGLLSRISTAGPQTV